MTDLYILLGIIALLILFGLYRFFKQKRILTSLPEEDFRQGYRKAQLIDVREPNEYDGGHILGARNIPLTQLKQRLTELRKDQPIYLYCQSGSRAGRAALMLNKNGYKDLYQLQGGFKKWTGKIKKTKKLDY
ncbi:rhodanese-related sulfurtransferase [Gracilibacillus halotolerans]|uniref:Rhodanese-related sulfurtransferase n=1 Tax=Gracilibacillus halotolerans TaxID=74386 RepID=A0A841RH14_9BACI|nr:rhodanese-related sulfurtransferase [Gracilibacillus halotolerans]